MISKFFISRPKFAIVISIIFLIAGYIAIETLPLQQFPNITPPKVSVTANYPGANAETVEKTVTTPLEEQINGVENMLYMSSKSTNNGTSSITVTFEIGSDPDMNTVKTNNLVSKATPQLPKAVREQGVSVRQESGQMLMILNVISPTGKYDGIFLSNFASLHLKDSLSRVKGVSDARIFGARDYSMRIWLNPDKLTAYNLSVEEVINAIKEQNVQVAAGNIGSAPITDNQQFQYSVQTKGRLSNKEEFKDIVIRMKNDGSAIRVKDVAEVQLGAESYSAYGLLNRNPTANLAIYQLNNANSLEVSKAVKSKLKDLKKSFGKDIDCKILFNTTEFVKSSINEVLNTLYIAVILVILIVFIFLEDWRSALIPTIAIPVSLIGTFAFLLAFGYSINTISLFGLILAIGIVVDDAIVVVENVNRVMEEENLGPIEATKKSMDEVTAPIIATTLVLMSVFVPVAFMPGITGELYRQFAITISIAVLISSINSLTLSPALSALLLKQKTKQKFIFFRWFDSFFQYITKQYNKFVAITIRKLSLVCTIFAIILISIYFLYGYLPTGFIPNEDKGAFFVNIQLPEGASLNRTGKTTKKVSKILENTKGVDNAISVVGFSLLTGSSSPNMGLAIADLADWSERTEPGLGVNSIIQKCNRKFAQIKEAQVFSYNVPPIQGLGSSGGFEFVLQDTIGNEPEKISAMLDKIIKRAQSHPAIAKAMTSYQSNIPNIHLNVDREKVQKTGLSMTNVFTALHTFLGGNYINDFNKFGKVYKVYLQAKTKYRDKLKDIYDLHVKNKEGDLVPFSTLMSGEIKTGPDVIEHFNTLPSATIRGSAAPGYSSGDAIGIMENVANNILPKEMKYSWKGTAYQQIKAGDLTTIIFILAIIFIYLFLVALYESWLISLAVMLSVPVAFLGALLGLWVFGIPNNIYAQIGFVLLFGMASKTAILIVEFAKVEYERGKPILQAAETAANKRFRAVIMTAFSALLGFSPLLIASGAGANSRHSIGASVIGGMFLATIIGTILIPSFYVIIQKIIEFNKPKEDKNSSSINK